MRAFAHHHGRCLLQATSWPRLLLLPWRLSPLGQASALSTSAAAEASSDAPAAASPSAPPRARRKAASAQQDAADGDSPVVRRRRRAPSAAAAEAKAAIKAIVMTESLPEALGLQEAQQSSPAAPPAPRPRGRPPKQKPAPAATAAPDGVPLTPEQATEHPQEAQSTQQALPPPPQQQQPQQQQPAATSNPGAPPSAPGQQRQQQPPPPPPPQQTQQPPTSKKKGKMDKNSPEWLLSVEIRACAKRNDLQRAISLFRQAQQQQLRLPPDSFVTLLYLAAGGDSWEVLARGGEPDALAAANVATACTGPAPIALPQPAPAALAAAMASFVTRHQLSQQQAPPQGAAAGGGGGAPGTQQQRDRGGRQAESAAAAGEGEEEARGGKVEAQLVAVEERVAVAEQVWAALEASGHRVEATAYLSLARLDGLGRRPDRALARVKEALAKCPPGDVSLRAFHPALVGFCMQRDPAGALEAIALVEQQGLDLTEYEFARLVEVLATDARTPAASWAKLQEVLLRMGQELEALEPTTVQLLRAFFSSPQSQAALQLPPPAAGGSAGASQAALEPEAPQPGRRRRRSAAPAEPAPRWQVDTVQVDESGACREAGARLKVVDLQDSEWGVFADSVASLARRSERTSNPRDCFDAFAQWYERHGPFDVLIDGANVAFYGQNYAEGGFNWPQVQAMYDEACARHPGAKVLLVMHRKRVVDELARRPQVQAFLQRLQEQRAVYSCPPGSNDDWYWMWATIRARHRGLLISNDELRDHIFQLLRPKHFLKWKARHIARYAFPARWESLRVEPRPQLVYPPAYTTCVQHLPETGAWMIPSSQGGEWLCARPARGAGDAAAAR